MTNTNPPTSPSSAPDAANTQRNEKPTIFASIRRFSDTQITSLLQTFLGIPSSPPPSNFAIDDDSAAYIPTPTHRRANSDSSSSSTTTTTTTTTTGATPGASRTSAAITIERPPLHPSKTAPANLPATGVRTEEFGGGLEKGLVGMEKLPAVNLQLFAPSLGVFQGVVREIETAAAQAATELEYYEWWERRGKPSAPAIEAVSRANSNRN